MIETMSATEGAAMTGCKVGDEVRIFHVHGKVAGQPDGGWPAHIIKADRTLVTAAYDHLSAADRFGKADGRGYRGSKYRYIRPLPEAVKEMADR
jgi:hypothetical protein